MKSKRQKSVPMTLRETSVAYGSTVEDAKAMIRTQIYLTRAEHDFLQSEGARRNEPMAAVIRGLIDEKMQIPEDAWTNNPLLAPTVDDPNFEGREDSSLNHDHYAYGGPKQYEKVNGKWALLPPLDE
ncbi:MAG TPA: hypothetical protein VGR78_12745 [Verrucomicrobiae bacterium]|jgi:hypothetical protein|nr:hypothetical protein [Verrucomicrobiae bacterium]